jgi:hypothetical protein
VAIHETQAGDAWRGPDKLLDTADDEHNWGATTLRAMNDAECGALAAEAERRIVNAGLPVRGRRMRFTRYAYFWEHEGGRLVTMNQPELELVRPIYPSVTTGHVARAAEAMSVLRSSGLPLPQAVIHCDSAPVAGAYFVWFASFPTDVEGAAYFIRLLAGATRKKQAASVLQRESGTEQELAAAMYGAKYFTGFHDPKKTYTTKDGRQVSGAQMNIDAYAGSLRRISPSVRAALSGAVTPSPDAPVERVALGRGRKNRIEDVREWQTILNRDAKPEVWTNSSYERREWSSSWAWPLKVDGSFGQRTEAATECWQYRRGLVADGVVGPKTRAAIG